MRNLTRAKAMRAAILLAGLSIVPCYAQIDPLLSGKQDLARQDWAAASDWFAGYLLDHPDSIEATLLAGNAALGLQQYEEARGFYLRVLALGPETWSAHANLAVVDAATERWSEFDEERRIVRIARDRNAPGLSPKGDVIDVLWVGGERYTVRDYYELDGRFHTRYNVLHFSPDRKLDFRIACESDDIDQRVFAEKHPTEAAAGQRSFSLDSYATNSQGSVTQSLIKFYWDGEPTYETARADVIAVLEGRLKGKMSVVLKGHE
ncbi:hypothetical protein [Nevskia soli]|uniref:hypothetical protein n=1 Tax=Nevskia soli TaxID=418856 RepID=UPI0015D90949|nr:hypothetical protein [Nevskia soli]